MSLPTSPSVVIVTGVSRGVGLAIVQELVAVGCFVLGVARTAASQIPAELRSLPADRFVYVEGDCSNPELQQQIVARVVATWGRLDALVLNAAIIDPLERIANVDLQLWRKVFDVNFFGVISQIQIALPHLRQTNGRIIVLSSRGAEEAHAGVIPYCSSKVAVTMLVQGLAMEEDLVCVAVKPGHVDTEMATKLREDGALVMNPTQHSVFKQMKKEGTILRPEAPGKAIARLALHATKELSGLCISWNDPRASPEQ
ncbi:uncharacterized protein BJ171DRAFT_462715 [Polychytrium aggregatum]|uniref:uncharacterized protein n=1 Tax=Polychytrium aggregatum TaxID=110093 RepID=UPI0022FE70AE|nr:uncharacterized protein BJ171DRAFT_462715 [Polychytrium aggregatum]KAI9197447.1 hypothetical protein BJ171DRAFT_462715 [Polychytrium aggregatum]